MLGLQGFQLPKMGIGFLKSLRVKMGPYMTNDENLQLLLLIAGFVANNVLQWAFYYPAVLYLGDLPLAEQEQKALSTSLASYREGDLLKALAAYPADRQPASEAERIYYAALVLSVGQVEKAEAALAGELTTLRPGPVGREGADRG